MVKINMEMPKSYRECPIEHAVHRDDRRIDFYCTYLDTIYTPADQKDAKTHRTGKLEDCPLIEDESEKGEE